MPITKQFNLFGQIQIFGDIEAKLSELYTENPESLTNVKRTILEYWKGYEGLEAVLEDRLPDFESWFLKQDTSTETITRCIRSLKENGTVNVPDNDQVNRQKAQEHHRKYWASRKSKGVGE
jgi:hypothetical protein